MILDHLGEIVGPDNFQFLVDREALELWAGASDAEDDDDDSEADELETTGESSGDWSE